MARIVIAGAGAIGASIAWNLALLGADDVVLTDCGEIGGRATGKAMGGVRQQFSTAAEVRLAQASMGFFEQLGVPFFEQVGYLFLATTAGGLAELDRRRELQASLGVPVRRVDPACVPGLRTDDVAGAVLCDRDGVANPLAVTRELVRRAVSLGVDVRERTDATTVVADVHVVAAGADSAGVGGKLGLELPVRPLCRQLIETTALPDLPALPMTVEAETGFHFRRRGDRLVLAMADPVPRWGSQETVDESLLPDRIARLCHRFPPAADADVARAWAGLYDMTPDAHPIIGPVAEGVYAACGFSGHGFMQSPAVGAAVARELLEGEPSLDLSPYRLERFGAAGTASFPETVVL